MTGAAGLDVDAAQGDEHRHRPAPDARQEALDAECDFCAGEATRQRPLLRLGLAWPIAEVAPGPGWGWSREARRAFAAREKV